MCAMWPPDDYMPYLLTLKMFVANLRCQSHCSPSVVKMPWPSKEPKFFMNTFPLMKLSLWVFSMYSRHLGSVTCSSPVSLSVKVLHY